MPTHIANPMADLIVAAGAEPELLSADGAPGEKGGC
jgi:hypothetical protein